MFKNYFKITTKPSVSEENLIDRDQYGKQSADNRKSESNISVNSKRALKIQNAISNEKNLSEVTNGQRLKARKSKKTNRLKK